MTRMEYIDGLRKVADWLESHPEVNLSISQTTEFWLGETFNIPHQSKEKLATAAKALGHAEKLATDSHFVIRGTIGGHQLDFYNDRQAICERVKVSEKIVPAHTLAASPETFVPEKVEEVYEWKCPESLLAVAR